MSARRWLAACVTIGDRLYVCGGWDGYNDLSSAERFDPQRGCWEALPPMSIDRHRSTCAAMGGQLYICGGLGKSSAEYFDPEANEWRALPDMSAARAGAACASMLTRIC